MKRPESYLTILDHWDILKAMPKDMSTVYVDIYRGTRTYDIVMRMKFAGHLFVGEYDGFIDRMALTSLGYRFYMEKRKNENTYSAKKYRKWVNDQLAEQWEEAYKEGRLPWQLGLKNPYD